MRQVKPVYECNAEVQIPEGNYAGKWSGPSITFQIMVPGQGKQPPQIQPCEIKATQEQSGMDVMVVCLGPFIYVYNKSELN